jgi:glucose/mannose-6-phosphate isomerase
MNGLDDLTAMREHDRSGMLDHVGALSRQCQDAWTLTRQLKLPTRHLRAKKVLIAGMGGSAIGGDLAIAVVADKSPLPILVHREYDLPAHVDRQTLVIASSYSGNTEETLSAFKAAHARGCPLVAVTTGGRLARLAGEWNAPCISFDYQSPPRAALGYLFVSLLGILQGLGVTGDLEGDVEEALAVLAAQDLTLSPDIPHARNRAKQLSSELVGRIPVVIGAGPLAPVARRWKTQLNENSKSWGYFEPLPEMNHNAVSGIHFPEEIAQRVRILFLSSSGIHARSQLRLDLSQQILRDQGIVCCQVPIQGKAKLAKILAAVQLGDYVSCYLAILYGADPTAIDDITLLKQRMSEE